MRDERRFGIEGVVVKLRQADRIGGRNLNAEDRRARTKIAERGQ